MNMKCYSCDKGRLVPQVARISGEVRGEKHDVEAEALVCSRCGFLVLTEEQSGAYAKAIADAYRRKHGLLTSGELKAARRKLRMSQAEFAKFVGVGEASIKRWESGLIQEEAHDRLIRLRTDVEAARRNYKELKLRLEGGKTEARAVRIPFSQSDLQTTSAKLSR